jgi:ribonuclease HI
MICTKNQGNRPNRAEPVVSGPAMKNGVYTDGSCLGNPGPGGWALVRVRAGEVIEERSGSAAHTTNNRMELQALIEALQLLDTASDETIWTDSELTVNIATSWAAKWQANGWKRKTGPVENLDLVQCLLDLIQARPNVKVRWLRGHAGHRWNERANDLAVEASKRVAQER